MPTDELLSTAETARILGITTSGVSRRVRAGSLVSAAKAPGLRGAFLFERSEVERCAAAHPVASHDERVPA